MCSISAGYHATNESAAGGTDRRKRIGFEEQAPGTNNPPRQQWVTYEETEAPIQVRTDPRPTPVPSKQMSGRRGGGGVPRRGKGLQRNEEAPAVRSPTVAGLAAVEPGGRERGETVPLCRFCLSGFAPEPIAE
jgi:hypothetical protein